MDKMNTSLVVTDQTAMMDRLRSLSIPQLPDIRKKMMAQRETTSSGEVSVTQSVGLLPHEPKTARNARSIALVKKPSSELTETHMRIKMLDSRITNSPRTNPLAAWPVKRASGAAQTSNKDLTVGGGRPPLAVEIESYIRKETRMLFCENPTPSKLQLLSIYREAFGCMISRFPEYGTAFGLIKQQYDETVMELSMSHHHLMKVQTENSSLKESHSIKLQQERDKLQTAINDLRAQLSASLKASHQQRQQQSVLEKDLLRVRDSLKEKDDDLDDAQDRIRLLTSSLRDQSAKISRYIKKIGTLKYENEQLIETIQSFDRSREGRRRSEFVKEDAMKVTAISESKKRAVAVIKSAISVNAPVAHEVDLQHMEEEDLREKVMELEGKIASLQRSNFVFQKEINNLLNRIEKLQTSLQNDTLTPRPQWLKVHEALPKFQLNHLASSEEILEDVIQSTKEQLREEFLENERKAYGNTVRQWLGEENICESDLIGKGKFFIGRGTGPHVPTYLRMRGKVKNRKIKKGDVENIINSFWTDRRKLLGDEVGLAIQELDVYLLEWLTKTTGSHSSAVELAYNLFSVCEKFQQDPDCSMFLKVFRGELCEQAVFDQEKMIEGLKDTVEIADAQGLGMISRSALHRILSKHFPAKARDDLLRLRFLLVTANKGSAVVDYRHLFAEDEDGNQSKFIEVMRMQHLQELTSFAVDVEEALRERIDTETDTININEARLTILDLDHKMPENKINEVLAFGCQLTPSELLSRDNNYSVEAEPFLSRMRGGVLLKRFSPKEISDELNDSFGDDDDDEVGDGDVGGLERLSKLLESHHHENDENVAEAEEHRKESSVLIKSLTARKKSEISRAAAIEQTAEQDLTASQKDVQPPVNGEQQ